MQVFEQEKLHGATPLSECELHDPPGEPGAVVPHARFGERRAETRLGGSPPQIKAIQNVLQVLISA